MIQGAQVIAVRINQRGPVLRHGRPLRLGGVIRQALSELGFTGQIAHNRTPPRSRPGGAGPWSEPIPG